MSPGEFSLSSRFVVFAATFTACIAARAEPFSVRDQNPLLAGFGLPAAMPARLENQTFSASMDLFWGSTALIQDDGFESLTVDAETREARFSLQGAINDRLSWQLQVPYRYTGGGSLDGFIDSWHDMFGLSEGARPLLRDDQINISYSQGELRKIGVFSSRD